MDGSIGEKKINVIDELRRALDISYQRNRVISENLANVETPGYTARKVDFRQAMDSAQQSASLEMSRSTAKHLTPSDTSGGIKIDVSNKAARADGNNVDQEIEIVNLSENTIIYNTATEILSRKLKMMRFAIEEGGK